MYREHSLSMEPPVTSSPAPAAAPVAIRIEGLVKTYGGHVAVDNVSFEVARGEIFGLLGKNGAGKTSIFEIIEGLRRADRGVVELEGADVARRPHAARGLVGAMLQSSTFMPGLNLRELVVFYARLKGVRVDPDARLAALDLTDKARALVRTLSGGQKQRFAFCIATLGDPPVLMLDEPSAGLDVGARRQMWDLIRQYRDLGRTVVLSTHYMEEAEQLCDRVAMLHAGRIERIGSPAAMIAALSWPGEHDPAFQRPATLEDVFLDATQTSPEPVLA